MALSLLAACGFQSKLAPVDDARDAADGGKDAAIDARIDSGDDDRDGDSVVDRDDNCPAAANLDQHDEDADQVGDVCDPCPQGANEIADGDADGVADACDPHPFVPGDKLVRFEPFSGTGNLPPGWQSRGGGAAMDWKRSDDALTIAANNDTAIAIVDAGSPRHAIDVGLEIKSVRGPGLVFVTALVDTKADIQQFIGCGMRLDTIKIRELFAFDHAHTPEFDGLASDGLDPPAVGVYHIGLLTAPGSQFCVIPQGVNRHLQVGATAGHGNSYVGVRVNNATVELRYVAVYTF